MEANRSGAFFLSLTLHAAVVALIFLSTYVLHQQIKETPVIFELVAGEGDNYAATEAPAATSNDPVQFNMPKITPQPRPEPTPVQLAPEPEPVIQTAPEPPKPKQTKVETKPSPKPTPPKPEPETEPKVEQPKKMTKAEFDKLHGNQKNPTTVSQPKVPTPRKIDIAGIVGGSVNTQTGAGGKALTRAESDALDAYIALLLQRLRAAHVKPAGLSDLLSAKVRFNIAANGTLSNVRIITSSGSREFDQSVLEAFAKVRSIGSTPNGKADVWEVTFKMREDG